MNLHIKKKIILSITFSLFTILLIGGEVESMLKPGTIKGVIYDLNTLVPLEFATITIKKAEDGSLVTGAITDINGFFRLNDVKKGIYFIEIGYLGYNEKVIEEVVLDDKQESIDLGDIEMSPSDELLDEVVVVADRPTMSYQIDKKVINVSQLHTSASGTAVDILENVPSVTVDIDGAVSLRGSSSFTVLVDGKPSILDANDILNQIPASQIENIEIITNPSARFDPDGVAGIINIVMKQNRLQGINGITNLDGGSYNRFGGDFLINFRKERFNFYAGGDYNQRGRPGQSLTRTESYGSDTTYLNSIGDFERMRNSWGFRGGIDFNINPQNTLSIAYRMGDRISEGITDQSYEEWSSVNPDPYIYTSFEESDRGGFSHTFTLDYKRDFNQDGHNILASVVLSRRNSEQNSLNLLYTQELDTVSGQRSFEGGPGNRYTFRLDYALPFNESQRFEAGYQSRISLSDEAYDMFRFNPQKSDFEMDELFSKYVTYNTMIHSLYSTYSGEINNLGYQFGLRSEYTDRLIELAGENDDYTLNRWDIYPTFHMSYQLPAEQQLMASYTRRLQRIRGWYLEPFYTWRDAYNIRIGNPNLEPEYIDSYELSYQKRFEKNVLSVDLYYRITNNKIEWVRSIYDQQPGILLTTFENVGNDYSLGTEIMMGFDPTSWWHFDIMGNLYDYRQRGELYGQDYSSSSFNWNARINNDFRITQSTRIQLRGMYNSPTVRAQGERSGYFVTNFAIRQNFFDNDLSFTLQVRDVFGTMARESINFGNDFYSFRSWDPNTPSVSLRVSFRINNYRADRRVARDRDNGRMDGMDDF
ncbi:MAG: TonB-dependent receptor domain-containing protein [Bacteroidales bacterium]